MQRYQNVGMVKNLSCNILGQRKRKSPRVVLLTVRKPHYNTLPHHTGEYYNCGTSMQSRKVSNLILGNYDFYFGIKAT